MTPSAVSKLITRLEQRLGTRLLNRSTRQLQLTPEGCAFYERGVRILADLEEAERCASENAAPRGRLRVNANVPFGHHFLLPLVPEFLAQHPEVTLDIVLTDEVVDILEQRTDVAVRAGPLKSSSLVARKLGSTRMLIVGAPAYLARHGMPATPQALLGTTASAPTMCERAPAGRCGTPARNSWCRCRATPRPAMARRCAVWPWPAWAWRGWPRSRCART